MAEIVSLPKGVAPNWQETTEYLLRHSCKIERPTQRQIDAAQPVVIEENNRQGDGDQNPETPQGAITGFYEWWLVGGDDAVYMPADACSAAAAAEAVQVPAEPIHIDVVSLGQLAEVEQGARVTVELSNNQQLNSQTYSFADPSKVRVYVQGELCQLFTIAQRVEDGKIVININASASAAPGTYDIRIEEEGVENKFYTAQVVIKEKEVPLAPLQTGRRGRPETTERREPPPREERRPAGPCDGMTGPALSKCRARQTRD